MSAKTVRAGKAEVEIGLKDRMQKGLDAAAKRLRSFGMGAAKIGAVVSGAGAAVLMPLLAAAKAFASAGDQVDKMAARTGMSTEAVSELAHAAGLSGSSITELEAAVKKMQETIGRAGDGAAGEIAKLEELNKIELNNLSLPDSSSSPALRNLAIDAKTLQQLAPDQQLELIADRFAAIDDPAKRTATAMAIFGDAGVKLIPMLSQGSAGIRQMREEAQSLGLSMDKETATAGAQLTDALARMTTAGRAAWIQIGGALAPTLTDLLNPLSRIVGSISRWIRENQALIKIVAAVAAGVVAVGAVISAIAGAAIAASFALVGIKLAIGAVAAVFAALTSPVGLVIGLIAAATWAFLRFTDAGQQLWTRLKDNLGKAWNWVKQVFEGIYKAVGAGDLELAAQIAWTAVLAVIANAVDWIIGAMDGLRGVFGETFGAMLDLIRSGDWQGAAELAMSALRAAWATGIANLMANWGSYIRAIVETFAGAMAQVAKLWVSTQGGISKGILALAQQEGVVGDMMAKILGVDVREEDKRRQQLAADLDPVRRRNLEGEIRITENRLTEATDPQEIAQLNQVLAHLRRDLGQPATSETVNDQLMGSIDAQTQASRDAIDAYVGDSLNQFTQWQDTAQDRADAANQDLADKIAAANEQAETEPSWADRQNEELRQLLERADVAAEAAQKPDPPDFDPDDGLGRAAALPALATASSWAVQAIAATGSAGRSPEEQIVENTRETNRQLRELNDRDKLRKRVAFK